MATKSWKHLNGIFCIYKPPNVHQSHVKSTIIGNLISDLNGAFVPQKESFISIEGSTASKLEVKVSEKLSVHPLAIGPGYVKENIRLKNANYLADTSSGVCLFGLNKAIPVVDLITHSRLIRVYRISGQLGRATRNLHHLGKDAELSRYSHVNLVHINKVLMSIQASHQRRAMDLLGFGSQSQEIYEALSEEGIVRPARDSAPLIYSLKCLEFDSPNFTLEISCINENEYFLRTMINDLGLLLKTNACTTKVHCIRYGPFNVDDALLRKHWRLNEICDNIDFLWPRVSNIRPESPSLQQLQDSVA